MNVQRFLELILKLEIALSNVEESTYFRGFRTGSNLSRHFSMNNGFCRRDRDGLQSRLRNRFEVSWGYSLLAQFLKHGASESVISSVCFDGVPI